MSRSRPLRRPGSALESLSTATATVCLTIGTESTTQAGGGAQASKRTRQSRFLNSDEADFYSEFPPGFNASGGDTPEAILHLPVSGFRFYGWSSLIADGRVQATDYAPDVGWLEVSDPFVGNWEGTDTPPDSSDLSLAVTALSDGTFAVTLLDDSAAVCDGVSSTMTGVAVRTEPGTYVIAQPEYLCDDGTKAETLGGPPLEDVLRNYRFVYDASVDVLRDGAGLPFTRNEDLPGPTASP